MAWEDGKYRASEEARLQPEQSKRAPGKKDRKRWCRGKVGVEHVAEYRLVSYAHSLSRACGWRSGREGRPGWYTCWHELACVNCGKILKTFQEEQCPNYIDPPGTAE